MCAAIFSQFKPLMSEQLPDESKALVVFRTEGKDDCAMLKEAAASSAVLDLNCTALSGPPEGSSLAYWSLSRGGTYKLAFISLNSKR
jgi:hypothetical protein